MKFLYREFKEFLINTGKHYYEAEDGAFILFRGTNRNESLHKRLKHVWPEKLGIIISILNTYTK